MSLFTVDPDKCRHDGLCAAECPLGLIVKESKDALPSPVPWADEHCINCGHCVAVCPEGAFSLAAMGPEDLPPIRPELELGPGQAEQFLRARRSIRVYQEKPVPRETLAEAIRLAGYAPSGHNTQPVHWLVLEDTGEVRRIAGVVMDWIRYMLEAQTEFALSLHMDLLLEAWEKGRDRVFRGAPHVIIAHAPEGERTATPGCAIALTYLELAAASLGLGTCWAGYFQAAYFNHPPMAEALNLPPGHASFGALMIGYPKLKYHRLPLRNQPRINWR